MVYKTLEHGYDAQMVEKKAAEYIQPIQDLRAYRDVRNMIEDGINEIIRSTKDQALIIKIEQTISHSEIRNMMEGTTNLINTVIEKKEPVHQ